MTGYTGGGGKEQSFPFSPTLPPASLAPGKSGRGVFHPHSSIYDANGSSPEDDGPHGRGKDDGDFIAACQQSKEQKLKHVTRDILIYRWKKMISWCIGTPCQDVFYGTCL